jgi:urease accessory protein UreE
VDTRLDHGLALALGAQSLLHRGDDLSVGERQRLDVTAVEIADPDFLHLTASRRPAVDASRREC